jgi:hypothetical protein
MMLMTVIVFGIMPIPSIYLLRRGGNLASCRRQDLGVAYRPLKPSRAARAVLHLHRHVARRRAGVRSRISSTVRSSSRRPTRRSRERSGGVPTSPRRPMRQATRDAIAMMGITAALFLYRMYVDPTASPGKDAMDWRFHLVWILPLVVVAFLPVDLPPYIVGGRGPPTTSITDVAIRASRAPTEAEPPEWAAARRRGAA